MLCKDLQRSGPARLAVSDLGAAVRLAAPGVSVVALAVCSDRLGPTIRALHPQRIVVGCRHAAQARDQVMAQLRRAGVSPAGTVLLDLMPADRADPARVAGPTLASILAAIARLQHADLDAPVRERVVPGPVSRLSLLHMGSMQRHPVAGWVRSRCDSGDGCQACVQACPRGALHRGGGGITVDEAACSGCGACLPACRTGAITIAGSSLRQVEAAAGILAASALRAGPENVRGVALTCAPAMENCPIGGDWLPLAVPSLEMVTPGWALALLAAGVGVRLAGCADEACGRRGRELAALCDTIAGHGAAFERIPGGDTAWEPTAEAPTARTAATRTAAAGVPASAAPTARAAATAAAIARAAAPTSQAPASAPPAARAAAPTSQAPASAPPAAREAATAARPAATESPWPKPVPLSFTEPAATVSALAALMGPGGNWRIESPTAPAGEIIVDAARCSACGRCAQSCPAGVLTSSQEDSAFRLWLEAQGCAACGSCVSACPESVITLRRVLDPALLAAGRSEIAAVRTASLCVSCGQPLAAGLGDVVSQRLAASFPLLAERLATADRCTDCLLLAR